MRRYGESFVKFRACEMLAAEDFVAALVRRMGVLMMFVAVWLTSFGISGADRGPFALRVSCGARENIQTPPSNTLWYKDYAYTGGRVGNVTTPNSLLPSLKTLRYFPLSDGPENCYHLSKVPLGHYSVRFFFAFSAGPKAENEPIFDVSIEGTQVYSLKPGWSKVEDQSFVEALISATDSIVSCCFHGTGHGDPSILAIEILEVDRNAYLLDLSTNKEIVLRNVRRLNCGHGTGAFDVDLNGGFRGGNRFWASMKTSDPNSGQSIFTNNSISGASVGPNFYPEMIYQSAIISIDGHPQIKFQIDVDPNKNYSLWFHFAEIDQKITQKGQRVFDILINDEIAFKGVDVIGLTGKPYAALVLNRTLDVNGRTLAIIFNPVSGGSAIVSAIEVFEVISAEFKTLTDEVRALQVVKNSLRLPLRFGWNGDPCVPQQHPWSGVDCQFDGIMNKWVLDGLMLDNQGLSGRLPSSISRLRHLQAINLSGNSINGPIPESLGKISSLETLDLSYNMLNGSIPESLGLLGKLKILNLNGNFLSGKVPASVGGLPLHGARVNFTGNRGLCGIPGLPSCGPHLSLGFQIGIVLGSLLLFIFLVIFIVCWRKRRQNILRAQKIATAREASYAKARTQFTNTQMGKQSARTLVNA